MSPMNPRGSPACGFEIQSIALDRQSLEGQILARARMVRDHDNRRRTQPHQLFEEVEAGHLRHLDIERDDIGIERLDRIARFERIRGFAHDFDVGRDRERMRDQLPHAARIIDDENPMLLQEAAPSVILKIVVPTVLKRGSAGPESRSE